MSQKKIENLEKSGITLIYNNLTLICFESANLQFLKKLIVNLVTTIFLLVGFIIPGCIKAQNIETGIKKIATDNFGGLDDISGDGRFVVFTSNANYSTVNNRNNLDGNLEVFLFDYAQRQVFQITNTKNLLNNPQGSPTDSNNIKLEMTSLRPRISNDGKYIVLVSNATTSSPTNPNNTNPGNFDANSFTDSQGNNPLMQDGNTEIWLYTLPTYSSVNLSTGIIPTFVDLYNGTYKQITNTKATQNELGFLKYDNDEPVINDNGCVIAFTSRRKLVVGRNNDENREIFSWVNNDSRCANFPIGNGISQITETPYQGFFTFVSSLNLSGNGRRLAFASNTNNPIIDMVGGNNSDFSAEVFFTDLNEAGEPDGVKKQVTDTTEPNPEITAILFKSYGKRLSRDGRYILFDSLKSIDSNGQGQGTTFSSYALYLYDSQATTQQVKQIGPRSADDTNVGTNDVNRFAAFTDYDSITKTPQTILFNSRININAGGTIPANPVDGYNPNSTRPTQIYSVKINSSPYSYQRITSLNTTGNFSVDGGFVNDSTNYRIPLPSNSSERISYLQFIKKPNPTSFSDYWREFIYLLNKNVSLVVPENEFSLTYSTGASDMAISGEAIGLSPNMLGSLRIFSAQLPAVNNLNATDVSRKRNFPAPIELNNVSITIDGFAAQLTAVHQGRIDFITPTEVSEGLKSIVINHNGKVFNGTVNIIKNQPDVVTTQPCPCSSGGRTKILNVTDSNNPTSEPFSTMTWTPTGVLPTKLRVFVTGVKGVTANQVTIKVGNITLSPSSILTGAIEDDYPGVYTFDFLLPAELAGVGDVPIVVTTNTGQTVSSRTESTASKFKINAAIPTDLAVWRPSNGAWYVMGGSGTMQAAAQWGLGTDIPAPGDYDGDGKTDFCVFRPSDGNWYVLQSSNNSYSAFHFGISEDRVAQSDYDGDGKTDYAVFRPSTTNWYVLQSSNGQTLGAQFGISNDELVPADYDGDGKADWAIWRNAIAQFWVKQSSNNQIIGVTYGQSGDKPVVGDYDGDGKYDFATWRGSDNIWRIHQSSNNQDISINWGLQNQDIAVQGDYDSDGKTDIAVWRSGWWYIRKSRDGQIRSEQWGQVGDIPVPAPYRRY